MNDIDIIKYFNNFKLIKWKTINLEIQNYLIKALGKALGDAVNDRHEEIYD